MALLIRMILTVLVYPCTRLPALVSQSAVEEPNAHTVRRGDVISGRLRRAGHRGDAQESLGAADHAHR